MRIAYILPSLNALAPNMVALQLVRGMMARGHQCHVFYFDAPMADSLRFPCPTRRISMWHGIDLNGFDVVHTHGLRPNLYLRMHWPHQGVKSVATIHSYIFEEFSAIYGRPLGWLFSHLFIYALRRHDRLVVLSSDAIDYYGRWLDRRRMTCCYNGVTLPPQPWPIDEGDRERILRFKAGGVLVGNICFLDKIKGLDGLIRALSLLPDRYRLLLIGEGDESRRLRRQAARECPGRVLFLGSRPQAYRYLPLLDVFAQTSWSEGFCLSMAEAAWCGRRIVSSDIPGMREKWTDEEVTYFPVGDAEALAHAIEVAAGDSQKSQRAEAKVKTAFTVEEMITQYEKVYRG